MQTRLNFLTSPCVRSLVSLVVACVAQAHTSVRKGLSVYRRATVGVYDSLRGFLAGHRYDAVSVDPMAFVERKCAVLVFVFVAVSLLYLAFFQQCQVERVSVTRGVKYQVLYLSFARLPLPPLVRSFRLATLGLSLLPPTSPLVA